MSAPKRIQRQRTKGWRMPEGAIYVGRPSRWGNPYVVLPTADGFSVFRRVTTSNGDRLDVWIERVGIVTKSQAIAEAVRLFRAYIEAWAEDEYGDEPDPTGFALAELRGCDLACWCPLDDGDGMAVPCHADVLVSLANRPEVTVLDEEDGDVG